MTSGQTGMDYIDIAAKLLNSHDQEIAAAAKRIFTPKEETFNRISPPQTEMQHHVGSPASNIRIPFSSSDIRNAAQTVAMLAPQHERTTSQPGSIPLGNNLTKADNQTFNSIPENDTGIVQMMTETNVLPVKESRKQSTTPSERLQRR